MAGNPQVDASHGLHGYPARMPFDRIYALDRTRRKVFGAVFMPAEDCAVGHQQNRIFVHRPRRSRSMLLAIRE